MVENIKVLIFKSTWKDKASFIRLHVLMHPSKMKTPKEKSPLVNSCSSFLDNSTNVEILLGKNSYIYRILD